jgi:hypothetical protein
VHEVLRLVQERARSGSRPGHRDDQYRIALIFPPATTPPVSRLTTDSRLLSGALESGREAARAVLAPGLTL